MRNKSTQLNTRANEASRGGVSRGLPGTSDSTESRVSSITHHPRHPVHQDRKLVQSVLAGEQSAIRKLLDRAAPFIESFASDRLWSSYSAGYQEALALLARNGYQHLQGWNGEHASLNRHLESFFRSALVGILKARRGVIAMDARLGQAIRASINDLSDTHYWLLCKILIDKIPQKQVLRFANELPELRIESIGSIGSTYSRALQRLEKVCPRDYYDVVSEFIKTRKRSGNFS